MRAAALQAEREKEEAARAARARSAQARADFFRDVAPSPAPEWKSLWSLRIGSTADDEGHAGLGQIALRGSMIVVASRGVPGKNDEQDGVYVVDGRNDAQVKAHIVRRIASPPPSAAKGPALEGSLDAVGVALDGDFVVYGTYGGALVKTRLDGMPAWPAFTQFPGSSRPGLAALVDLNEDGQRDIVVPVIPFGPCAIRTAPGCAESWSVVAIALDGTSGKELWRMPRAGAEDLDCADTIAGYVAGPPRIVLLCADAAESYSSSTVRIEVPAIEPSGKPLGREAIEFSFAVGAGGLSGLSGVSGPSEKLYLRDTESLAVENSRTAVAPTVATLHGPIQALPSLGDLNFDGEWEAVLVANGELQAFATRARGESTRLFWRGDAAASGATPSPATPGDYGSQVGPRDRSRWLEADRAPGKECGCADVSEASARSARDARLFVREPLQLPVNASTTEPVAVAELDCRNRYGLNEGSLVVRKDGNWQRVSEAPWPLVALGCEGGELLLERPSGQLVRMPVPVPWQQHAFIFSLAFAIGTVAVTWYMQRDVQLPPTPAGETAWPVILSDGPRTERADAHPKQKLLLDGLLNVLDNDDTRPPLTVALYGPWGSGKSSLLRMLQTDLKRTGRYIDVWFNAWRFQREQDLAGALLQSIVDEVGKQTDAATRLAVLWHRIRTASPRDVALALGVGTVAGLCFAISLRVFSRGAELGGTVGALLSSLLLLGGVWSRFVDPLLKVFSLEPAKLLASGDSTRRIQFVREFAREFGQISQRMPHGTRLIVFIDDLDRCAPDRVVNVLEALSMLADTGCGFFVMAIDPVSVRRSVELTYKDMLELARREDRREGQKFGSRYLEKMVTLGVNVPAVPASEVEPDKRLQRYKDVGFFEWLKARAVPRPPLLLALLLAAGVGIWISQNVSHCNEWVDQFVTWLLPHKDAKPQYLVVGHFGSTSVRLEAESTPDGKVQSRIDTSAAQQNANAAEQEPGAAATQNAGSPPATAPLLGQAQSTPAAPQNPTASAPNQQTIPAADPSSTGPSGTSPQPPSAPKPPAAPALFELATESPADARRFSEQARASIYVLGALAGAGLFALFFFDYRRRQLLDTHRRQSDSEAFATGLRACRRELPANPRNVVRFTNLCRFLQPIVSQHRLATGDWQPQFFDGLRRRWLGEPDSKVAPWLETELDDWIPADVQSESPPSGSYVSGSSIPASAPDLFAQAQNGRGGK